MGRTTYTEPQCLYKCAIYNGIIRYVLRYTDNNISDKIVNFIYYNNEGKNSILY
jgi:hypothetical protein